MPRLTYKQLQKELTNKRTAEKNLKKRVSTLKAEVLRYKGLAKSLPVQYERIIKEYKKSLDLFISNSWKLVAVVLAGKFNERWSKMRGR
jgi:hypothetical protein